MTDSKVLTGRQGRRLSRFRRSPKLAVPKFLLQLSGTYNFPKIDSELTPGHKPKRNGTDRWACTYIRTLSSVWSVSLSWWSSPRLPCQAVFIPLVQPGTSLRPAQNEKSQLCVYSEIALIKWPRRGRLQLRTIVITICAWGRCIEDGVHTFRANIYRPPLNWRETDQVVLFLPKIMEDLIIRNYDACDQVIMNFLQAPSFLITRTRTRRHICIIFWQSFISARSQVEEELSWGFLLYSH